jgi:hypothetical protein
MWPALKQAGSTPVPCSAISPAACQVSALLVQSTMLALPTRASSLGSAASRRGAARAWAGSPRSSSTTSSSLRPATPPPAFTVSK